MHETAMPLGFMSSSLLAGLGSLSGGILCYLHRRLQSYSMPDPQNVKAKVKSLSPVRLFGAPWTVAYQAPPSMGFSRQEYWSGLPVSSPRDLPDPGIEHGSVKIISPETMKKRSSSLDVNLCLYENNTSFMSIMPFTQK